MANEEYEDGPLKLEIGEDAGAITVTWRGRSVAREPGQFLLPILTRTVEKAEQLGKRVVIDFTTLEYLNSSTITPVIRILELAKRGNAQVSVVYDNELKWQALSFSALYLFQSHDGRVTVESR